MFYLIDAANRMVGQVGPDDQATSDDEYAHQGESNNQHLARFGRSGSDKWGFDDADIVLPNTLGNVRHLHSREHRLVERAVGFNFTNEGVVWNGDFVELQRRLFLLLKRSRQLGFRGFGR